MRINEIFALGALIGWKMTKIKEKLLARALDDMRDVGRKPGAFLDYDRIEKYAADVGLPDHVAELYRAYRQGEAERANKR